MRPIKEGIIYSGAALAISALAFTSSCGGGKKETANPTDFGPKIDTTQSPQKNLVNEIERAIHGLGLTPRESVSLDSLHGGTPVTITNYDPSISVDSNAVNSVYGGAEALALANLSLKVKVKGEDKVLVIGYKERSRRDMAILPPQAFILIPNSNLSPERFAAPALTVMDSNGKTGAYSILRVVENEGGFLRDKHEFLTASLAIEACQQVAVAGLLEEKGNTTLTVESLIFAQELACNSIGVLVASAALGKPYEDYRRFVDSKSLSFGPGYGKANPGDYPYVAFSQDMYDVLLSEGAISKTR